MNSEEFDNRLKESYDNKMKIFKHYLKFRPFKDRLNDNEYLCLIALFDCIEIPLNSFVQLHFYHVLEMEFKTHVTNQVTGNVFQEFEIDMRMFLKKMKGIDLESLVELFKHLNEIPGSINLKVCPEVPTSDEKISIN